ncbi:MAG: TetR/AcrR family transcriptional regulator [Acidimicrobiales bacterium]
MSSPDRREALLRASLTVIRRDGPTASMDAMAAEAGITKPILYRHFGDRSGLLSAVASRFADELVVRLGAALAGPASPSKRIEVAVRAYVTFIEEDPELYGFLTQRVQVASLVDSGLIERVADLLQVAITESLEAAGLDSTSAETWAYGVVGMMHVAGAHYASTPGMDREDFVSDLLLLASGGLVGNGLGSRRVPVR